MRRFRDLTTKEKKEYLAILLLLPFAYIGHLFRKANFRTLPKRAVAVCLALVMIAVMIPIMSIPASAEEYIGGTVQTFNLDKGDLIHAGVTVKGYPDLPFRVYRTPGPNEPISAYLIADNVESWTADKSYYVVWDGSSTHLLLYPASDITFYPNGGTAGGTTAPSTFLAVEETDRYYDVSWLNPYRPGCTFLGWYTSDGTEQVYNANGEAVDGTYWKNNIWQGQGAKSFIAKWKANTSVTFRYFPGGGIGQPDNFEQWTANATYFDTYPSDSHWNYTTGKYKLTRVGYTATGNYAKKDGSCVVHEDQTFTSYPQLCKAYGLNPDTCGNATIDIYAQWTPINYTVTFDAQGGTTSLTTLPVLYDSNQNNKIDKATNPVRTDYTFIGWFTAPEGGEQVYQVSNGSCLACTYWSGAYDSVGSGATWKYAGNVTLYAQWSYSGASTITFDAQGGTTTLKTLTATYGSNTNNLLDTTTNPTKEGYTFDGWFDSPTGGTQVYKVSNGSCIKGDYWTDAWEFVGKGATWKGPKELTLYAHWIPKKYTVTWKNHDGSVLETDTGVAYDTTPTYNGATPTKPDDENFTYTFGGWSPAVCAVTGDAEYTAQFTAVSKRVDPTYTVTIPAMVNEGESFTVSATGVVLNTDEKLTVTLQSDFTLTNEQGAELGFKINDGAILNNTQLISVTGNGDKNNPLSLTTDNLVVEIAEEAKYSGTYQGTITFTIAVDTAENN